MTGFGSECGSNDEQDACGCDGDQRELLPVAGGGFLLLEEGLGLMPELLLNGDLRFEFRFGNGTRGRGGRGWTDVLAGVWACREGKDQNQS